MPDQGQQDLQDQLFMLVTGANRYSLSLPLSGAIDIQSPLILRNPNQYEQTSTVRANLSSFS